MTTIIYYRLVFEDGFSDWSTDKEAVLEYAKMFGIEYEWKEVIC